MTDSTSADTASNPRRADPFNWIWASSVVAIVAALAGHALQWRWLMLTALLVVLVGSSAVAVVGARPDTRSGRFAAAVFSVATVVGWIVTVWLVEFPPVMVQGALTVAVVSVIAAIGTRVNRRLHCGCCGVGAVGHAVARVGIVHRDSDTKGDPQ